VNFRGLPLSSYHLMRFLLPKFLKLLKDGWSQLKLASSLLVSSSKYGLSTSVRMAVAVH